MLIFLFQTLPNSAVMKAVTSTAIIWAKFSSVLTPLILLAYSGFGAHLIEPFILKWKAEPEIQRIWETSITTILRIASFSHISWLQPWSGGLFGLQIDNLNGSTRGRPMVKVIIYFLHAID